MLHQTTLDFRTRGRGTTDIVAEIEHVVAASGIAQGICNVFLQHTSASPPTPTPPASTTPKAPTTWPRMRARC